MLQRCAPPSPQGEGLSALNPWNYEWKDKYTDFAIVLGIHQSGLEKPRLIDSFQQINNDTPLIFEILGTILQYYKNNTIYLLGAQHKVPRNEGKPRPYRRGKRKVMFKVELVSLL